MQRPTGCRIPDRICRAGVASSRNSRSLPYGSSMHALRVTILGRHRIAKGDACSRARNAPGAGFTSTGNVGRAREARRACRYASCLRAQRRQNCGPRARARCSVYSDVRIFQDLQRFCAAVAARAPSLDVPGFPDFRPDLQREPPGRRNRTCSRPKPEFGWSICSRDLALDDDTRRVRYYWTRRLWLCP